MITRLYANNFRCLVAFEAKFDSFGVLCAPNGAGKSSVFDVLRLVRDLATGNATLGGDRERDVGRLERTNWIESSTQEFEIDLCEKGLEFCYVLHLEQVASHLKPRVILERATSDGKELFVRDLQGVKMTKPDGAETAFPLDWRQAALGSIQSHGEGPITKLQSAFAQLLILRPSPREMEAESRSESQHPDLGLTNVISWYRHLCKDTRFTDSLRDSLAELWPDFSSLKIERVGLDSEVLLLRFKGSDIYFHQLSDGEKALFGLNVLRAAVDTGTATTVLIDEPDNYVGLPELQPWVLSLMELLDDDHQAILISHHPEVLAAAGAGAGRYIWRDRHSSPSRIGPLEVPEGISVAEAIARGWVRG